MTPEQPGESAEEILSRLLDDARRLWGEERAQELRPAIEQTAHNLHRITTFSPDPSIEPGFYQ